MNFSFCDTGVDGKPRALDATHTNGKKYAALLMKTTLSVLVGRMGERCEQAQPPEGSGTMLA